MTDEKKEEVLQTEEKVETTTEIKQEHHDEFWLRDSKDVKIDEESKHFDAEHHEETDEIDIAIVNEIAVTDDDPTLQAFSVRALVVGVVSITINYTKVSVINYLTTASLCPFILCESTDEL